MYEAHLSPVASKKFDQFPYYIQEAIAERIERLCEDPGRYSVKAGFPYAPTGQVSTIKIPKTRSDEVVVVGLHFRFGQDEASLEVFAIGSYVLGEPGGPAMYEDE